MYAVACMDDTFPAFCCPCMLMTTCSSTWHICVPLLGHTLAKLTIGAYVDLQNSLRSPSLAWCHCVTPHGGCRAASLNVREDRSISILDPVLEYEAGMY